MSSASNRSRRLLRRRGTTTLEFALILIPFLWLIMSMFDLGRYLYTIQALVTQMADAHRFEIISHSINSSNGMPQGCSDFNDWSSLTAAAPPPMLDPSQGTVCVTLISSQTQWGATQVQVTVQYPFIPITPGLAALTHVIESDGTDNRLVEQATYSY